MALGIAIVGLPNVGKSTTFNALTKAQNAEAANYPFCTIEPNKAIVPLPDKRLQKIAEIVKPKRVTNAVVEFVDIAGLVEGASKGEGLGNKFLGNIRQSEAIVHLVRCFDNDNVVHISAAPDPKRDVEIIETELILADLEQLERKLERLEKQVRMNKKLQPTIELAERLKIHLENGKPVSMFEQREDELFRDFAKEMGFITDKKVIFAANVDEEALLEDNQYSKQLREIANERGCEFVKLCAKLEEDMVDMTEAEKEEFLEEMGLAESGLEQIVHKGFDALGLMTYFTAGEPEVRAWTIGKGWTAPQAAGVIHSDFERGFIRAEVISYSDFIEYGGEAGAKAAGKMNAKGKSYVMKDGDVVHFLFNV